MTKNLIQPIIDRGIKKPDHLSLIFIDPDGTEQIVTAGQFHQSASLYANAFTGVGINPGDLVILVLKHSQVLLSAFWGAMYLGAIPSIFPFLTEKLDPELYLKRVKTLVGHSQAKAVITFPEFKEDLEKLLTNVDCKIINIDEVAGEELGEIERPLNYPKSDAIAFLQHSSGTTGLQKGVALSHEAVINQIESYGKAIELNDQDVIVSWLPLYHDMGLIAGFVLPLYTGTPLVIMSPFQWVRDPKMLLYAIDKHRGTLCWLPNFAYNHMARTVRPSYLGGVDLSSLRALINCSEPAHAVSHEKFLNKFSPYGFNENALTVCYAMAENTFAVTQTSIDNPANIEWVSVPKLQEDRIALPVDPQEITAIAMVSCGKAIEGSEIIIVDDSGESLEDRYVGEVFVRSNCMLTEYYQRPEITAEAIVDGWYHPGDMGYLADGDLYITGRKKDLIIVGGKNVYPQDLETIANNIPGIYPGRAVAFGVFDDRLGSETVVIVCELQNGDDAPDPTEIERELRRKLVEQTEVTLADLRLVENRWLIKTSSGKIARGDNREKYLREYRN